MYLPPYKNQNLLLNSSQYKYVDLYYSLNNNPIFECFAFNWILIPNCLKTTGNFVLNTVKYKNVYKLHIFKYHYLYINFKKFLTNIWLFYVTQLILYKQLLGHNRYYAIAQLLQLKTILFTIKSQIFYETPTANNPLKLKPNNMYFKFS